MHSVLQHRCQQEAAVHHPDHQDILDLDHHRVIHRRDLRLVMIPTAIHMTLTAMVMMMSHSM
jgi:hypothetical protein